MIAVSETDLKRSSERWNNVILSVRGRKVIIDADLARLYGMTTAALNQAVRRNAGRFPEDFAFRLTAAERSEVITNCDHLEKIKYSRMLPLVFTEHGAVMAASVLNSEDAVRTSVLVVRAFVAMRRAASNGFEIGAKLNELEHRVDEHDAELEAIVREIKNLILDSKPAAKRIGFRRGGEDD
ncbi:MAG: ORF6N domain-containing protein [Proteobacteria bacterium]|jgi:hypothetical protein|nr:ORF6N domain-containing protein [Pseudomonadota bacterium]